MSYTDYKELMVWQKSIMLAEITYKLLKELPPEEKYALADQMRRAVISIPSNIAEGHGRGNNKEFIYFLKIANGSKTELETQLILCEKLGYLSKEQIAPSLKLLNEIGKMIYSLIRNVSEN